MGPGKNRLGGGEICRVRVIVRFGTRPGGGGGGDGSLNCRARERARARVNCSRCVQPLAAAVITGPEGSGRMIDGVRPPPCIGVILIETNCLWMRYRARNTRTAGRGGPLLD